MDLLLDQLPSSFERDGPNEGYDTVGHSSNEALYERNSAVRSERGSNLASSSSAVFVDLVFSEDDANDGKMVEMPLRQTAQHQSQNPGIVTAEEDVQVELQNE